MTDFLYNKNIVCVGDSWTAGHEFLPQTRLTNEQLSFYQKSRTWAAYIELISGRKTLNLGIPGAANSYITNATIDWVEQNPDLINEDLFIIIGWSAPVREFLVAMDENNDYWEFSLMPRPSLGHNDFQKKYHTFMRKNVFNPDIDGEKYKDSALELSEYLTAKGINFTMFNGFCNLNYTNDALIHEEEYNNTMLPKNTVNKFFEDMMSELISKQERDLPHVEVNRKTTDPLYDGYFFDSHPNNKGHYVLMQHINDHINKHREDWR